MMIKKIFNWLRKIFGIPQETPFDIVDNLDLFVKDKLNLMLNGVNFFDIATGYFQISGWQAFSEQVEKLIEKGGKVRILIGDVSKEYLLPQTAKLLLHLIKNPNIEARTIKPRLLHAKLFMAKTEKELRVLFGSSNVTFGGMEANIELNIYEVLNLDSRKAKSLIEWYEKLWESAIPIDEELKVEILFASQKEEKIEGFPIKEDQNKALFLSLLIKDLARVDLRDIGNFVPLKFQYIDAVAGINRFFFQPGEKRGLMLAHEVGLGKTIISGMILKHLLFHKYIKNVLIVAPLSIIRQWMEDLKNKFNFLPLEITSKKINGFKPSDFNIYIISYDLLREHIEAFYKNWDFIVIDESHFIRNKETQRFKAVKELKSKFYLLLTATPMHNKIEDITTQFYLFVPEEIISKATKREILKVDRTKLFQTFIKRRLQKKELKEIIPEREVLPPQAISLTNKEKEIYESLKDFLSQKSKYYQIISRSIEHIAPFIKQRYLEEFVSSKEACLFALINLKDRISDAINKGYIEYNFGILKKESEGTVVDEIRSFIEDELETQSTIEISRDEEGNLIVQLSIDEKIKKELKSDIEFLDKLIKEIEEIDQFSKVKKVVELIERLSPSGDRKIIVFVGFIKTGETITKILKDKGIKSEFFYGELREAQREKLIKKLWEKAEERIDVLISTDAAYVGLNLQIADTIVHHDFSWNPMVIEQRIGRIHRIGQKKVVTSYSFVCKDTIDMVKHKILTKKLKEITTNLKMSYSVVLSEVALSSQIEKIMAQLELKEIDENTLEEKLKQHITERREIFELLEELPSEEKEIVQVGFTNSLIEKMEDILWNLLKIGKEVFDFKIQPVPENNDFFILEYKKNGKKVRELSTLNEKAVINVNLENVRVWKEKYGFENVDPSYVGPFHYLIDKISEVCIERYSDKFWKKKISGQQAIAFYTLFPLNIENPTAEIKIHFDVFVPILYDPKEEDIKIDALKTYNLIAFEGNTEDIDKRDKSLIERGKEVFQSKINDIKSKIKADIEKVKIEIEELAIQKHRAELEAKLEEKRKRLENLMKEIFRKRNSGLKFDKEMNEVTKLSDEISLLQKDLEKMIPESSIIIEIGEPKIMGGCFFYS